MTYSNDKDLLLSICSTNFQTILVIFKSSGHCSFSRQNIQNSSKQSQPSIQHTSPQSITNIIIRTSHIETRMSITSRRNNLGSVNNRAYQNSLSGVSRQYQSLRLMLVKICSCISDKQELKSHALTVRATLT